MLYRMLPIWLLLTVMGAACQPPAPDRAWLHGSWQVDSLFRYYNGFTQRIPDGSSRGTFQYFASGKVREQMNDDYREFLYTWQGQDSLYFHTPEGDTLGVFQVLSLAPDRLVLRRAMDPLFDGPGQERYEIRYFSRIPN
ncbi:MAG: hypothetical protein OHK0039_35340 [Bacteroidia bacterium]